MEAKHPRCDLMTSNFACKIEYYAFAIPAPLSGYLSARCNIYVARVVKAVVKKKEKKKKKEKEKKSLMRIYRSSLLANHSELDAMLTRTDR